MDELGAEIDYENSLKVRYATPSYCTLPLII